MEILVSLQNLSTLECFSSPTRIRIIELLREQPMNIKSISEQLNIKSPIVTRHIQMLENAGIVRSELISGKRGQQKLCFLEMNQLVLKFQNYAQQADANTEQYHISIPIGMYSNYKVMPSCGLASEESMLGICDDPRYFADPVHRDAKVLWFASGFVEYTLPNYMLFNEKVRSLDISLELCSGTPCSDSQINSSEILFSINQIDVANWIFTGTSGNREAIYTPTWWTKPIKNGVLKHLRVNEQGTFIDGVLVSNVTIDQLQIEADREIVLRISNVDDSRYCGGVTLFGRQFGNYNQDINCSLLCISDTTK